MADTRNGVTIDNGTVTVDGNKVGEVMKDYKHGYHPAVRVTIDGVNVWFELDTKNLIDVVFDNVINRLKR